MIILGIETSCDETSASIIEGLANKVFLKSNIVSSSMETHIKTGGIIPENAAREQIKFIIPVIQDSLEKANTKLDDIDYLAVTYGPGLIGSLLVGVETVKTIAYVLNKPIIPVNHMLGHVYANFVTEDSKIKTKNPKLGSNNQEPGTNIQFPAIALVVSGGHTDLLLFKNHGEYKLLGGTRDDAAGEAFDKIGRLLNLAYPGGPEIEKAAKSGNPKRFRFPRPLIGSTDFDFSFSGLKTAVLRETQKIKSLDKQTTSDIALAAQDAIIDVLIKKTLKAAQKYDARSILISGGVAANQKLRDKLILNAKSQKLKAEIFVPQKSLCTDNAAMIATAAYFNQKPKSWNEVSVNPELYFDTK